MNSTGVASLADGIRRLVSVTAGAPQIMKQAEVAQQRSSADYQNVLADTAAKLAKQRLDEQALGFNQGYHDALPGIGQSVAAYKTNANPESLGAMVQAFFNANQGGQFNNVVPTADESLLKNQMVYSPETLGDGGLARAMAVTGKPMYQNTNAGTLNTVTGETALTDLARSAINENNAQAEKARMPWAGGKESHALANHVLQSLKVPALDDKGQQIISMTGPAMNIDQAALEDLQRFYAANRNVFPTINDAFYAWQQQRQQAQPAPAQQDPILDVLHSMHGVR